MTHSILYKLTKVVKLFIRQETLISAILKVFSTSHALEYVRRNDVTKCANFHAKFLCALYVD